MRDLTPSPLLGQALTPARLDEVPVVLAIGEGQFHYQALNNLAITLRELLGPTTG